MIHRPRGDDDTRVLRHLDELVRAHDAALRVVPADQRLKPGDPSRLDERDGLIVKHHVPVLDRRLEARLQLEPGDRPRVDDGVEHYHGGRPFLLGANQGSPRVVHDLRRIDQPPEVQRDAHAHRETEVLPTAPERLVEGLVDAPADTGRVADVLHVVQQDHELVATEARDGVGPTDAVLQTLARLAKDLVRTLVSHTGVHLSEAVEVHEEHGVQVLGHPPGLLVLPERPSAGAM